MSSRTISSPKKNLLGNFLHFFYFPISLHDCRYLLEAASGIFTGSRYKDLQLQMYGEKNKSRKLVIVATPRQSKKLVFLSRSNLLIFSFPLLGHAGFYGEIRDWRDGTTLVQKTHDASPDHVKVLENETTPSFSFIRKIFPFFSS